MDHNEGFNRVTLEGIVIGLPVCRPLPPDNTDFTSALIQTDGGAIPVAWYGETARRMGEELEDGTVILVDGRLDMADWETRRDGKRERLIIKARTTKVLGQPYSLEDRP